MRKLVVKEEENLDTYVFLGCIDTSRVMYENKLYEFEDYYYDCGDFVMINEGENDADGDKEIIEVGRIPEGYYDIYECDGYYEIEKSFIEL